MSQQPAQIVNVNELEATERTVGDHWGAMFKCLTPKMREGGGSLGVNWMRVPPGRTVCPFHDHAREDEAFFVLSGRGVLRYGDELHDIREGDCISCPAGTGIAHQIVNSHDEDLIYLAIGHHDPDEVCTYPDSGKVLVRSLRRVGKLADESYFAGEPDRPKILDLVDERDES